MSPEGDDEDGEPGVAHAAARHSMQILQCYFVKQGFSDELHVHAAIDSYGGRVVSKAHSSMKWTT